MISRRFDAWFFLALAPAHSPPKPDLEEVTEARWFEPAAALAAADAGEVPLAFPTRVQLGWLAEHGTSDAAIAAYRDRPLEPIEPRSPARATSAYPPPRPARLRRRAPGHPGRPD